MPSQRSKAIVVIDTKTLGIEHVYVHMTMKAAMREFVGSLKTNIDSSYSDMRDELEDALDRYHFVPVGRVTIGRFR